MQLLEALERKAYALGPTARRFYAVAFGFVNIKKVSHLFDFAAIFFFSLSSASLLDFFFP